MRNKWINVKVTEEERKQFKKEAAKLNMKGSWYFRHIWALAKAKKKDEIRGSRRKME